MKIRWANKRIAAEINTSVIVTNPIYHPGVAVKIAINRSTSHEKNIKLYLRFHHCFYYVRRIMFAWTNFY